MVAVIVIISHSNNKSQFQNFIDPNNIDQVLANQGAVSILAPKEIYKKNASKGQKRHVYTV